MLFRKLRGKIKDDRKDPKQVKKFIQMWMREELDLETKNSLFEIIKLYVCRLMAAWESNFVYEIVVDVYDDLMFREKKIQPLKEAVIEMVREQDLYQQFIKGMFLYLLAYISYSVDDRLASKWDSVSWGLSIEVLRTRYPNINND